MESEWNQSASWCRVTEISGRVAVLQRVDSTVIEGITAWLIIGICDKFSQSFLTEVALRTI
ncbi:hypothetical protein A5717_15105 [Mycolicibacterium porcinum]|nr:hypothetical protein A5717_15105 [Mycolicibacterium porcinum]